MEKIMLTDDNTTFFIGPIKEKGITHLISMQDNGRDIIIMDGLLDCVAVVNESDIEVSGMFGCRDVHTHIFRRSTGIKDDANDGYGVSY